MPKLRSMKIQNRLILSFLLMIIIPTIGIFLMVSKFYERILVEKLNGSVHQMLIQMTNNINNTIYIVTSSSTIICLSDEIERQLAAERGGREDAWRVYQGYRLVAGRLKEIQNSVLNSFNAEMAVLDFAGRVYRVNTYSQLDAAAMGRIRNSGWFRRTVALNGRAYWSNEGRELFPDYPAAAGGVTFARLIKGNRNTGGSGLLVIYIPKTAFWKDTNHGGDRKFGTVWLLDKDRRVISADNPQSYSRSDQLRILDQLGNVDNVRQAVIRVRRVKTIVNSYPIDRANWTFVHLIPYDVVMKEVYRLEKQVYLLQLVLLALLVALSIAIARNLTQPIRQLQRKMIALQHGDFTAQVRIDSCEELNDLGNSFNTMSARMDDLMKKIQAETRMKEMAHLRALQAQINPHFLFNTLNSIKWLATMSGTEHTANMITELGRLLEATLYRDDEMISIAAEIDLLHSYIALQRMRYGEGFRFENRIADGRILNNRIPKFTLQPLVENALIHGIAGLSAGIIILSGELTPAGVMLEIRDNGSGIPPEKLSELLAREDRHQGRFSRIGLKNVHERLRLKFGAPYGITVQSELNEGTAVQVLIPLITEESVS
ncbi:histidine kinase/DNA gyrase B/HSP90-like ATPase [Hydrogenispora ethanolica]|uniref:Histidine kinase/DNA gyrase B/HSP90-like ATPase n=1 Tax=Hydrogenispora ethanolica TaxID=1082276 RepID=A0A4R1QZC5_HYDET|nr:sensor histidine kinase [Hydrogenispora ethanolica]TCL58341.1 histidine kinase/DNA gyrase B/HSP90-like ATPase [Hydrogenispora ethanolica]